jgi:hypothetical protein
MDFRLTVCADIDRAGAWRQDQAVAPALFLYIVILAKIKIYFFSYIACRM